jgi:hypothetical protein
VWIFGGAKTKLQSIAGANASHHCEDCDRVTEHRPVAVKDKFHLFFVELGEVNTTGYACVECGEVVEADQLKADAHHGVEELGANNDPVAPASTGAGAIREIARLSAASSLSAIPQASSLRRDAQAKVDVDRVERELAAMKNKK